MQFKYGKCITIFNVHTLDIIKSNVMVYVLYLRLIYYIHVHVVCILLCMEGQISLAIDCIFTEWISDRDHVIWGSEVMGAEMYELLFFQSYVYSVNGSLMDMGRSWNTLPKL